MAGDIGATIAGGATVVGGAGDNNGAISRQSMLDV